MAVVGTTAAIVAVIAFCVVVAIERSVGYGFEALFGALFVLSGLATLTGRGTTTMTIPGMGEFVLGDLPGRSPQAWALRGMRFGMAATFAVIGGFLVAQSVTTVSAGLLVRGFALAFVPMSVAFAFLRWVLRAELAEASEAAKQLPQSRSYTIEVPRPSKKLKGELIAEIARHPAVHSLLSLGMAGFLVLIAISPELGSTVSHVISFPFHVLDGAFDHVIDWVF